MKKSAAILVPLAIIAALVAAPALMEQPTAAAQEEYAEGDVTLEAAKRVVEAAIEKSNEIDTKMNVAVVDAGGNLKAFAREDGAWLGSIDIAIKKAKTARYFDMPSHKIGELSQPGGSLYNIEHSNDGLISFPGGVPLKNDDGEVIGAVGVSGSTVENDLAVAEAGAEAL